MQVPYSYLSSCSVHLRHLHSFPTRRSSDLPSPPFRPPRSVERRRPHIRGRTQPSEGPPLQREGPQRADPSLRGSYCSLLVVVLQDETRVVTSRRSRDDGGENRDQDGQTSHAGGLGEVQVGDAGDVSGHQRQDGLSSGLNRPLGSVLEKPGSKHESLLT